MDWSHQDSLQYSLCWSSQFEAVCCFISFWCETNSSVDLVLPHFNYCDITNNMTVRLSDKLQCTQDFCIKFNFSLRREDHVTPLFAQLSMDNDELEQLHEYAILILLRKILHTDYRPYLSERFLSMSSISTRSTRQETKRFSTPAHRTTL